MPQPELLLNAARFYKQLPHQDQAFQWLGANTSEESLSKFRAMFSPPVEVTTSQDATVIQDTAAPGLPPIVLDQLARLKTYCKDGATPRLDIGTTYYSQRDNYTMGGRTCNSSSSAMYLDWLRRSTGQAALGGDNDYLKQVLAIGDTIYHENQTAVIAKYGFKTRWLDVDAPSEKDFQRVNDLVDAGFPVPVNILHRGSIDSPRGGHIVVICARRKSEGTYILQDPYGTFSSGYTNENGRYSLFSPKDMRARWQGGMRVLA
jgi:hypothetical protein